MKIIISILSEIFLKIKSSIIKFNFGFNNEQFINILIKMVNNITNKKQRQQIYLKELKKDANKEDLLTIFINELNILIEPEERYLIPSFEKGYEKETDRFSYQKEYINFNIKSCEKVLDIGSGGYPFPYATHIADLYKGKTSHRSESLVRDNRPFIVCNIENLPFKNKEFDFIYCSHVLEHVSDPAKACEEIMRVGKRGYIETPTRTSDIMLNFIGLHNHHKWYINLLGNTLIFIEWNETERIDTGCNDFFKMLHSKYKNSFQNLFHRRRNLFINFFLWNEIFYYFIFDKDGKLISTNKNV